MRIAKKCSESDNGPKKLAKDIPQGTIFRHRDRRCGPYLRVLNGYVDLRESCYLFCRDTLEFSNYKELPNAYLVTGEE